MQTVEEWSLSLERPGDTDQNGRRSRLKTWTQSGVEKKNKKEIET